MKIVYQDKYIVLCIKPAGVKSTDEPGGVPELVREALGEREAPLRTVHRLDQVVSGLMLLGRTKRAASELGQQVMERGFEKEYLAVVHGRPEAERGTLTDLLWRDKAQRMTFVAMEPGKDVQEAVLDYELLEEREGLSLLRIRLRTGRTHQIRVQFSSRGLPLVGERKYAVLPEDCDIALWSHRLAFDHPKTGERMDVAEQPPAQYPWNLFNSLQENS